MTLEDLHEIFQLPVWGTIILVVRGILGDRVVRHFLGPRVLYMIQKGQFVLNEHLDWVTQERNIYFYVCRFLLGYIPPDIGRT